MNLCSWQNLLSGKKKKSRIVIHIRDDFFVADWQIPPLPTGLLDILLINFKKIIAKGWAISSNFFALLHKISSVTKNHISISLAVAATLISISPQSAHAGAWLQNEGEGQVISSIRYYTTARLSFDPEGNLISSDPFAKLDTSQYFEYGLKDFVTLGGEINLATVSNENPGIDDANGLRFSYGSLFARTYLYPGDSHVVSVEPGFTIPQKIGSDLVSDGSKFIPELKLNYGYSFKFRDYDHFWDSSVKYRWRNDTGLEDMMKLETSLGLRFTMEYTLLTQLSCEHTMSGKTINGNYDLLKPQLSVLHDLGYGMTEQIGLFVNVYGENTGSGGGVIYSYWIKF